MLANALALLFVPSAMAVSGGTAYYEPPALGKVWCHSSCLATPRSSVSGAREVAIREGGVLSVRGRNLRAVKSVLFLGGAGSRDNTWVAPRSRTSTRVDVLVPARAMTGRLRLVDAENGVTRMSVEVIRIHHPPPPPPPNLGLIWPVTGPITSPFGEDRGDHSHAGIDIGAPSGTPIKAVAPGNVIIAGWYGGYGRFTCIAHAAISTCYAHQSEFLTKTGERVQQGQVIGRVGCTGNCYGDHLHFEVREGTHPWAPPRDPLRYLPPRAGSSSMGYRSAPQDYDLPVFGL